MSALDTKISKIKIIKAAAEAAGLTIPNETPWSGIREDVGIWNDVSPGGDGTQIVYWNPLKSNNDALWLACKVLNWPFGGRAFEDTKNSLYAMNLLPEDHEEATRLIITYASAYLNIKKRFLES